MPAALCVYCGSNVGAAPEFIEVARQLGDAMARRGIRLVYGGGHVGLMGVVADAVLDSGGEVTLGSDSSCGMAGIVGKIERDQEMNR